MSNAPDYSLNEQIYQNSDKTIRIYKVNIFLFKQIKDQKIWDNKIYSSKSL